MRRCRSTPRTGGARRGIALAAVLVVGLGLLLIAVSTLHLVRAEVSAIAAGESRVQSRFAARAAARALMRELADQRGAVLAGLPITTPDSMELFDLDGGEAGRVAIARLLPIGIGGDRLVPEAGRLDLNVVDAEALVATGLLDRTEAETAIAARDARPSGRFTSVFDLLALEGDAALAADRVLGPLEDVRILSRVDADEEDLGDRIADRLDADLGSAETSLVSVLTVHAFEPDVRRDGSPRATAAEESPEFSDLDDATSRLIRAALGIESSEPSSGRAAGRNDRDESTSPEPATNGTPASDGLGSRIAAFAAGMPDADLGSAYDAITGFDARHQLRVGRGAARRGRRQCGSGREHRRSS